MLMAKITHIKNSVEIEITLQAVQPEDYKNITKSKYYFAWKTEKENEVYKLSIAGTGEIVGLMSLIDFPDEQRLQISLLAVSKENRGKGKVYSGIAENLIAYACRESTKRYAEEACVSLLPKTELKKHYIKKYGMIDAGWQVFLEGPNLFRLLEKYSI